jgi:conjugal transfer/entry exclusion protein
LDNRGMLRLVLSLSLVAALCGCTVVPNQAWHFDPTNPQPRPVADAAKVAPLTNRIAELQIQLNQVRTQIAAQPDTEHRLPLYSREHRIGKQLSPLQRELDQYAQAR